MLYSKKIQAVVAAGALALTVGLVGCGGGQTSSAASTAEAPSTASTAASTATSAAATDTAASTATSVAATDTASSAAAPANTAPANEYIGDDAAKDIALADAGLTADGVTELKSELDLDDATIHYDVDFKANGMEYDYDIDAMTGAIITAHSEVDD